VRVILLDVIQVEIVVFVANLAVSVVTVWHRFRNLGVVRKRAISIRLKLSLEILFVFLLALAYNFVEFLGNELELGLAHTGAEAVRRIHLEFVNVVIAFSFLL